MKAISFRGKLELLGLAIVGLISLIVSDQTDGWKSWPSTGIWVGALMLFWIRWEQGRKSRLAEGKAPTDKIKPREVK